MSRALLASQLADDGSLYRQHMLLRAYARALLEQAGELHAAAARHVAYYEVLPGQQAEQWQAAEAFWEQIEQGWHHAWRAGPETALRFYDIVSYFLHRRARHAAHIEWASALLALPAIQIPDKDHARLLNNIGMVYTDLGEKQQALAYYEQALPLSRQVGDQSGEATTLTNIGSVYSDLGEKQQALAYYEQALPLRRQVGDRAGEARTLNNIGVVYDDLGEKQQALAYFEQALPLIRQVGDRAGEATTLNNIGYIYFQQGQPDRTVDTLRRAIQLDREVKDVAQEAGHLYNLAVVLHHALNQTQEAIALVTQSIAILQRYHLPRDANGATLAQHQAFLAQLKSSA